MSVITVMFGDVSATCGSPSEGVAEVEVDESSQVLDRVLLLCYPRNNPSPHATGEAGLFWNAVRAFHKYGVGKDANFASERVRTGADSGH